MGQRITVDQVVQGYAKSGLQPTQACYYDGPRGECGCGITAALLNDDPTLLVALRQARQTASPGTVSSYVRDIAIAKYGYGYTTAFACAFDGDNDRDSFEDGDAFQDGLAARRAVFGEGGGS